LQTFTHTFYLALYTHKFAYQVTCAFEELPTQQDLWDMQLIFSPNTCLYTLFKHRKEHL